MGGAIHPHSTSRPCLGPNALAEQLKGHSEPLRAAIAPQIPARWRSLLSCEDILQQTFLDAFLAAGSFVPEDEQSFARWLRRLAQNNLIEAIRGLEADKRGGRVRRITKDGRDDACTTLIERLVSARTQTTPSRAASRRESAGLLHEALAKLPPAYREVVTAYDLEGHSMADVAATLGRSPGAAHLLRVRAHRRLEEILAEKMSHF